MQFSKVIRPVAFAAVVLSAGWTSAYGYIPGEALILSAAVAVATPVAIARCAMETNPPTGSIRARRNLDIWEREGLAVSRVLASPLNVLLAPCGMNYVNITKKGPSGIRQGGDDTGGSRYVRPLRRMRNG